MPASLALVLHPYLCFGIPRSMFYFCIPNSVVIVSGFVAGWCHSRTAGEAVVLPCTGSPVPVAKDFSKNFLSFVTVVENRCLVLMWWLLRAPG